MLAKQHRPRRRGLLPLLAMVLLPSTVRAEPTAAAVETAEPTTPDESIRVLHARGDALFSDDRYAEARQAWLDAFERSPADQRAYRTTLLSLITSATIEDFRAGGEPATLDQTLALLQRFSADEPDLDPELRGIIDDEIARLEAMSPTPDPTEVPVEPDPVPEPAPQPPPPQLPADGAVMPTPEPRVVDEPRPARRRLGLALVATGPPVLAGGLAALIAGSRFRPRAVDMVAQYDDPTDREDLFVAAEVNKGVGWMSAGGAAAVVGTGLLVGGIAVLVRSRGSTRASALHRGGPRWHRSPGGQP